MSDDTPHSKRPLINALVVGPDRPSRVVFLHGLFGQGRNFAQIAKSLLPQAQSVLVDLPNHGRSDWIDTADYVVVADLVADWLRSGWAARGPVHLVGHSMGGKVAMVLALRHRDLVDRLVVADISPTVSAGAGQFVHLLDSLAALDLASLHRRSDADAALAPAIADAGVRGFLLQNLRSSPDDFSWQANLTLLRRELETIGGFPDLAADGTTFDHPVLWIAGEHSDYVSPADGPVMRRLFPATRLATMKGAGHWVHSDQPDVFSALLRTFLLANSGG